MDCDKRLMAGDNGTVYKWRQCERTKKGGVEKEEIVGEKKGMERGRREEGGREGAKTGSRREGETVVVPRVVADPEAEQAVAQAPVTACRGLAEMLLGLVSCALIGGQFGR